MAANDSGLDTSNDSNDNSLNFPAGFNQAFLVQYTTRNDFMLLSGGSGGGSSSIGGLGAGPSCSNTSGDAAMTSIAPAGPSSGPSATLPPPAGPSSSSSSSFESPPRHGSKSVSHYRQLSLSGEAPSMHHHHSHHSHHSYKMKSKHNHQFYRHTLPYILSKSNERKLRLAASLSNIDVLLRLLEAGVDPNSSDDYQRSALHLAASRGYTDVVTQLLKYGAKPNLKDSLGNTPLHLAVCSASSSNFNMVVRILLKYGASVHATDRLGKNPLDLAKSKLSLMRTRRVHERAPEACKMLLDMSLLTGFLLWNYTKEAESQEDINSLERRLQELSTKEVENEADMLLAKVEQLTLKN